MTMSYDSTWINYINKPRYKHVFYIFCTPENCYFFSLKVTNRTITRTGFRVKYFSFPYPPHSISFLVPYLVPFPSFCYLLSFFLPVAPSQFLLPILLSLPAPFPNLTTPLTCYAFPFSVSLRALLICYRFPVSSFKHFIPRQAQLF